MTATSTSLLELESLFTDAGELQRYGFGKELVRAGEPAPGVWLILKGRVRSLVQLPPRSDWRTAEHHEAGDLVGWLSLLHGRPTEHLRTADLTEALFIPAEAFLSLWRSDPALARWCASQSPAVEVVALLNELSHANPARASQLDEWKNMVTLNRNAHQESCQDLEPKCIDGGRWYWPDGTLWPARPASEPLAQRLIWLPDPPMNSDQATFHKELNELLSPSVVQRRSPPTEVQPLQLNRASGLRDIPMAICQAVADVHCVPAHKESLRDQIDGLLERQPSLNLYNIGQLLTGLDLSVALIQLPLPQLARIPTPAVIEHQGSIALIDGIDQDGRLRLLEPELGPLRVPAADLLPEGQERLPLLLIRRRPGSKEKRFSWSWYGPYLLPHRQELIQVLACSAVLSVLGIVIGLGIFRMIQAIGGGTDAINGVVSVGAILIVACVLEAIVTALRSLIFTGIANRVDMDTRETILDRLVRLPQGFFDERPVGRITYYFTQLDRLRDFLIGKALTSILDFGFSFLYLAVLWWISPTLTLITLSALPLFVVLAFIANPLVDHQIDRTVEEGVKTNSYLTEAITGIQTIKSQNAELKTRWEFQTRYASFIGEDYKLKVSGETIQALAKFINELSSIAQMVVGIYLVSRGDLNIAALFAFRIMGNKVTGPMIQLVQTWQEFKVQSNNLTLAADIVDRPTEQSELQAENIPMPPIAGHVSIQGVDFRYSDEGPQILNNVSVEVPEGTFVGMVGGSGSGKSTVLKLLSRFYEPENGRILIDGLDIAKVELYSLRRQIGVVPQDSLLFDGTIKDNLLMVKPDASSEELIRAAKIACAHDFIMEQPQGYNSPVGERGAGLSGGQRQRMALARAVLQNPRLLILDEATSALDARTERQVCLNLFDAFRGRTVFFITHRLATVRPADMIVLMDQGAVMEVGDHAELMQRQGWYYGLHQSQHQEGVS
jgi:subfamily B ATP-binding cassette protein HlyB/CyaB